MIWATVSSWSCFCLLYRASASLSAKNIINLILMLIIWWCPCVESSLVLLEALDFTYYLHFSWKSQSSGKVERVNQYLKWAIQKITQKKFLGWKEALPIALLYTHIAPMEQLGLSPYEMLYGRPFVFVNDLFLDPHAQTLWSYIMAIRQFQQHICIGWQPGPKRF